MIPRRLAALAALALLFAACSAGPGNGGELQGTQWVLQSYDDGANLTVVPDTVFADAEFANHRVTGTSGCNQYDAVYRSGGRTIFIAQPKITLMACDEATLAFEQRYLSLLQGSRYYGIRGNTLTIYDAARSDQPRVRRSAAEPAAGPLDVDSFESDAIEPVAVPLPGTTLNVRFGIATSADRPAATRSTGPTARTATSSGSASWPLRASPARRCHGPGDGLPQRPPGRRLDRLPRGNRPSDGSLRQHQGRADEAGSGSSGIGECVRRSECESGTNRERVGLGEPVTVRDGISDSEPDTDRVSDSDGVSDSDRDTDCHPDSDCGADGDCETVGFDRAEHRSIGFDSAEPAHGVVSACRQDRDRRQDRLSRELVHGDVTDRGRVPVL